MEASDSDATSLPSDSSPSTESHPSALLVFIHGFKGSDQTFESFPARLHAILEQTTNLTVETLVYPSYETHGELDKAVEKFVQWSVGQVAEREAALNASPAANGKDDGKVKVKGRGRKGGMKRLKVVLLGHSMGGLVASDAYLSLLAKQHPSPNGYDPTQPLWPDIRLVIANDTPYYGLNPSLLKNAADKYIDYAQKGSQVFSAVSLGIGALRGTNGSTTSPRISNSRSSSSGSTSKNTSSAASSWTNWSTLGTTAAAVTSLAGVASAAYLGRQHLGMGYAWASSHLEFVGALWNEESLRKRMEGMAEGAELGPPAERAEKGKGKERAAEDKRIRPCGFHCFYTYLPEKKVSGARVAPRTFAVLPSKGSKIAKHWSPNTNTIAADEVAAHTSMFNPTGNDGFYALGAASVSLIQSWLEDDDEDDEGDDHVEIRVRSEEEVEGEIVGGVEGADGRPPEGQEEGEQVRAEGTKGGPGVITGDGRDRPPPEKADARKANVDEEDVEMA